MNKKIIQHFFLPTFRRRLLYMEACFFLLTWHVIGKVLPLEWYKRFFGKRVNQTPMLTNSTPSPAALKISYTIIRSAQIVPWRPVCYPQALAAKSMLKLRGLNSVLYFGAASGNSQRLIKLHCWIAHRGVILTGKKGHKAYKVIQIYT